MENILEHYIWFISNNRLHWVYNLETNLCSCTQPKNCSLLNRNHCLKWDVCLEVKFDRKFTKLKLLPSGRMVHLVKMSTFSPSMEVEWLKHGNWIVDMLKHQVSRFQQSIHSSLKFTPQYGIFSVSIFHFT